MAEIQSASRKADPDRDVRVGDDAVAAGDGEHVYVLGEHDHTAGEIVFSGQSLAEFYEVAPRSRVVWITRHQDLDRVSYPVDTYDDVVAAVRAGVVVALPFPARGLQPLVDAEGDN